MMFSRSLIAAVAALLVLVSASRLWGGIAPLPGALSGPAVLPALQPAPRRLDLRIDAFASSQARFGSTEALRWQATKRALQRLSAEAVALRTELVRARAEMAQLRKSAAAWGKSAARAAQVVTAKTPAENSKRRSAANEPIEADAVAGRAARPRPNAASTRHAKSVPADQVARPPAALQKRDLANAPVLQASPAPNLVTTVPIAAAVRSAVRPAKPNSGRNQRLALRAAAGALRAAAGDLRSQARTVAPARPGGSLVQSSQTRRAPLRKLAPRTPPVEAAPRPTEAAAPASVANTVTVTVSRKKLPSVPLPALASTQKSQPKSAASPPPVVPDPRVLTRQLQRELSRVGCDPGPVDGIWGRKSRQALKKFAKRTGLSLQAAAPSRDVLTVVAGRGGRICPLVCGANSTNVKGRCIANRSKPRQVAKPAALRRKAQSQSYQPPQPSAQPSSAPAQPQNDWIQDFWDQQ